MNEYLHNLMLTSACVWLGISVLGFIFWPQVTGGMSDKVSVIWLAVFVLSIILDGVFLYTYYS